MLDGLECKMLILNGRTSAFSLVLRGGFETGRALPPGRKLRGSRGKALLRAYASRRLPPEIVGREKKGFGAPLGRWFRGELRELVEDVLSPASLDRHGIFEARYVSRLLREHAAGRRDHRKRLLNLLMFQLWWNAFAAGRHRSTGEVQP